ncbi:PREDICTED: protein SLOW GREEN 1, chloroplastic-like [Tarenaya hassleriana]|uniref:protein SLOW GREEN 1, chloroplastic-like n=1 Tax=Tarenaya hassleriana TaxID=28532 RepID=UPI00053C1B9E|nr:PREDICTED: protein SLOW GREEN 1, chloroplastic-like [Tarenaya hassleriana]XP_010529867.1 PREDICTED: protein SLOW GREEN 1, chloroplastic-like [Tarenaya hassleriana]
MGSLGQLQIHHQPFHLSLSHGSSSFPKTLSSCSFRSLHRSTSSLKCSSISASSSKPQNPRFHVLKSLPSRLLKSTCITFTAAAALFFVNLQLKPPAFAAPFAAPSVESMKQTKEDVSLEEGERAIEEHLASHPTDVDALRSLMEVRIKSKKLVEAIEVIDRLIELEPDEKEWPVLKANIFSYSGDLESAKQGFEEILEKDPLRVEAYHGLVMAYSDSGRDLKEVEKRIQEAMEECKKEKNLKDFRDFKLLVAQIRVIEGKHNEALKLYQELVKEEPRDFRPYLCQGIIYTLLKKKDEAEKQFDKFRKLVPRNHPYREYFMDNMVATKLFAEKAEREMAGSKS